MSEAMDGRREAHREVLVAVFGRGHPKPRPHQRQRFCPMDANSLKAFLTIVDQGSFSEAAETLHLTQPAISKRLAALETQLGTRLIDRSNREIRLTEAGTRLLPHARRILDEIHNARVALTTKE